MSENREEQKPKAGQPGWQPVPGVTLRLTLRGHGSWVCRIAWSPDGNWLASPSFDKTICIWDANTGDMVRTLTGHSDAVWCVAWSPNGQRLASAAVDMTVRLWDAPTGRLLDTLERHVDSNVVSLAWSPDGRRLALGSEDKTVQLWDAETDRTERTLEGHTSQVWSVAWSPDGRTLASASDDNTIRLWDTKTGEALRTLDGHTGYVSSVAWCPKAKTQRLVSASFDETVRIWQAETGQVTNVLKAHTGSVNCTAFAPDFRLIASKGGYKDDTVRLWRCDTWEPVAVIPELAMTLFLPGLAFHPCKPLLATVGSDPGARYIPLFDTGARQEPVVEEQEGGKQIPVYDRDQCDRVIHIWELDYAALLGDSWQQQPADDCRDYRRSGDMAPASKEAAPYVTAKIVLVGDTGVGKTGLGWRLAHGKFQHQKSSHGQQFWMLDQLSGRREDRTRCEAVLWDLAGQPDYRLIHALSIQDADLALVLFDPTDARDPLGSVEYWLGQLPPDCPKILVAARVDRGGPVLSSEELDRFCQRQDITGGWLETSAVSGQGLDELLERMSEQTPWNRLEAVTTTATFKRIKNVVLQLKQDRTGQQIIFTGDQLRDRLESGTSLAESSAGLDATLAERKVTMFSDAELMTAVERLASHGFVRILRLSNGQRRILLVPELLNNLASSFVLEARRNRRGLGALEENLLLDNSYRFPELEGLDTEDHALLLDATITGFLENRLSYRCFRESWGETRLLVFPELMKIRKPKRDDLATEEGASYVISGATENTFASLVVLLGYTDAFLRTDQARDVAYYEYEAGVYCGVRQEHGGSGERTFQLLFSPKATQKIRLVFEGLVEKILSRMDIGVWVLRPVECWNCQTRVDRNVMTRRLKQRKYKVYCEDCGRAIELPRGESLTLKDDEKAVVTREDKVAEQRTQFEEVAFEMSRLVQAEDVAIPTCFVSYAWGQADHERWVEHRLATDLEKAGIRVILDRWENADAGRDFHRFVERISGADLLLVVGTPAYRHKFENRDAASGTPVAAEIDQIAGRLSGTGEQSKTVVPLLLAGNAQTSLPPQLADRVHYDYRDDARYFNTTLLLLISLYRLPERHRAVRKWKRQLGQDSIDELDPAESEEDDRSTDAAAMERALQKIGSRARASSFDLGQPVPIQEDGKLVWVYKDGTVSDQQPGTRDDEGTAP